jgi:diguanylate cyclase (GGDEF)-like protein
MLRFSRNAFVYISAVQHGWEEALNDDHERVSGFSACAAGTERAPFLFDAFAWEADLAAQTLRVSAFSEDAVQEMSFAECWEYLHAEDAARIKSLIASGSIREQQTVDCSIRVRSGGEYRRYRVRGRLVTSQNTVSAVGMAFDAGCSEGYLQRLRFLETHDELTGLYNARMLDNFYETSLQKGMLPQTLIVATIDALKEFNETMGYQAGNTLIKNVADVMKECFFDADLIARVGGGDFCVAYFGTERSEIEHRIDDATMQLHKTYLNLMKANVTFGFAFCTEKEGFSPLYSRALAQMKKNGYIKKVLSEPCAIDPINEIIAQRVGWGKRVTRLTSLAVQVGTALGCNEEEMNEIRILSRIVDLGLIGIEERLLKNRAQLSGRDKQDYLRYVEIGRGIISSIDSLAFMEPLYLQVFQKYGEDPNAEVPGCVLAAVKAFDDIAFERGEMEGVKDWLRRQKSRFCPEVVKTMMEITGANTGLN